MRSDKLGAVLTVFLLISSSTAFAVDFNWNVLGPGDWGVGANWDPAGPPAGGGGNFAYVNNGGVAEITADISDIQDIFVGAGDGTSGTLNQSAGNTQQGTTSWMFVGQDGGTGTYNLSGGVQGKDRLYLGRNGGNGTLNLSGTGEVNSQFLILGEGANSVGTANITGGSIHTSVEIWVGQGGGGTGTVHQSSGVVESDTWIAVGRDSGTGTYNLTGDAQLRKVVVAGNPDSEGSFFSIGGLGSGGVGTVNVQDEAVMDSATGAILGETDGQVGIINQSGGTVMLRDYTPRDFQPNLGQALNLDPSFDPGDPANTGDSDGEYHLSGGTLVTETVKVGKGVFDMTGGVFTATNFIGDLTQMGGTTSPGASPGIMTITGDYALNSGDLFMELDGLTPGTGHDQLIVTGDVSLAGDLSLAVGFSPSNGDMFTIIDNQGGNAVSGTFTQGGSISAGGYVFSIDYMGGDGNDVVLTVVPEPAAMWMLLAGLFATCWMGRLRK